MPWDKIIIGSFAVCTFFLVVFLLTSKKKENALWIYPLCLVLTLIWNTYFIYWWMPPLNGPLWGVSFLGWSFVLGCVASLIYAVANMDEYKDSDNVGGWSTFGSATVVAVILVIVGLLMQASAPFGIMTPGLNIYSDDAKAKDLASLAQVKKVDPSIYPETTVDHINFMPPESAVDRLNRNGLKVAKVFLLFLNQVRLLSKESKVSFGLLLNLYLPIVLPMIKPVGLILPLI